METDSNESDSERRCNTMAPQNTLGNKVKKKDDKEAWKKNQHVFWFFTASSQLWGDNESEVSEKLGVLCKKYSFQLELGTTTGYLHWQGCFQLKTRARFTELLKKFGPIHLEVCDNFEASRRYCMKLETRVRGPWTEYSIFLKYVKEEDFWSWQKFLKNMLMTTNPDGRSIYWIFETEGKCGKSSFIRHMCLERLATTITSCRESDLAFIFRNVHPKPRIVLIDLPRTLESQVNYGVIERLLDGCLFDTKYEGTGTIFFDPPHVVVFANFEPDYSSLSRDRWKPYEIKNFELELIDVPSDEIVVDPHEYI